jgi:ribose transport system substrate-binding protein
MVGFTHCLAVEHHAQGSFQKEDAMSVKLMVRMMLVMVLVALLAGCTAVQPAAQAPADQAGAAAEGEEAAGKFYWVQSSAWHPVHQYTQQAFMEGCKDAGIDCELATTDENSIDALVALADQTVSKPGVKGVAMWFGGLPVAKPIIEKAKAAGIPVALPHFPVEEGFYADNAVQIAADTTKYPDPVAKAMCDELTARGITTGSVAITQNNFNATEDMVAKVFSESMAQYCPDLTILPVELEGPEPTGAIAVATAIMQAHPDLVAALSTTGGGPTTWAGAQKETGKQIVAVGMDATRVNLDLVKNGEVWGLVAQPLYEESKGSAELLAKMAAGEEVPYWTVLEAPLVTADNTEDYYAILDRLEPMFREDAVNPDAP